MGTKAIRKLAVKQNDGSFAAPIPIGAYAKDVILTGGKNVEEIIINLSETLGSGLKPIAYSGMTKDVNHPNSYIKGYDFENGAVINVLAQPTNSVEKILDDYGNMFIKYGDQIRLLESKIPIITVEDTVLKINYKQVARGLETAPITFANLSAVENLSENNLYINTNNYANIFEWDDGNLAKEDRGNYFVSMNGNKLIKATSSNDYILGVTFDVPTDLENSYKYSMVCMSGRANVRDDNSCVINGFCQPNNNGIATRSDSGFRVLDRIAADTVTILIK